MQKNKSYQNILNIEYILKTFKKSWLIYIVCLLIALAVVFIHSKFTLPVYEIGSSVLINAEENAFTGNSAQFMEGFGLFSGEKNFYNELQLLKSINLISTAIDNLNYEVSYYGYDKFREIELYKSSPFIVVFNHYHPQPINVPIEIKIIDNNTFKLKINEENVSIYNYSSGKTIQTVPRMKLNVACAFGSSCVSDLYDFKIIFNDNYNPLDFKRNKYSFIIHNRNMLAKGYQRRIEVEPYSIESSIAQISLKSKVPQKDIDFLVSLTNEYLKRDIEKKNHIAVKTIEYIDNQLNVIVDSLKTAEENLQRFRTSHEVMDISLKTGRIYDQMQQIETEKRDLMVKYKYYQYIDNYFEESEEISDLVAPSAMGLEDPMLNNMIQELIGLNAEKVSLIENNQEKSPYLKKLNIRIENLKNTISENIKYVLKTAEIAIQEVNSKINRLNVEINKLPKTERELFSIEREFNLNNQIYTYLLEKRAEAQIAKASNLPNVEIIEPAAIIGSGPIAPKKKLNYVLGIILGFIIPFSLIRLKDLLNNRIKDKDELTNLTDKPLLGQVYRNNKKVENVVQAFPKSHIAESFRMLRNSLYYFLNNEANAVLLVTSTYVQEGKSFISLNLASSLASTDKKTIILGFDLRKPILYERLKVNNNLGISSFLSHQANYRNIIQHTSIENLDIITSGPIPPNPSELILSSHTSELFKLLKKDYEYIIVDTPPIGILSDTYILMGQSDLNIYVVRQNHTSRKEFISLIQELNERNIKNICLVLNEIPYLQKSKYGYDYYDNK